MSAGRDHFGVAQHSFIRSVECENNSEAWTNLGVLYLVAGESQLANAAFKESQNCDPSYLHGWTGQSLLADAAEGLEEEAMDLFRYGAKHGQILLKFGSFESLGQKLQQDPCASRLRDLAAFFYRAKRSKNAARTHRT